VALGVARDARGGRAGARPRAAHRTATAGGGDPAGACERRRARPGGRWRGAREKEAASRGRVKSGEIMVGLPFWALSLDVGFRAAGCRDLMLGLRLDFGVEFWLD
jgi:hypothetical protein